MRLTWSRLRFLAIFYVLFPIGILGSWIGFLCDEIFYRKYRKIKVKKPLFIIGNFRSGSTLLQRVLARDHYNFTCLRTWEIYIAPSITQRKLIFSLMKVDKLFGSPIFSKLQQINKKNFSGIHMHKVSLYEPEEDEGLFVYLFATFFIWFVYPKKNLEKNFVHFDQSFSPYKKRKMMEFYKSCIQRHLYFHHNKHAFFLSKNPSFTPKIASIIEVFPDARFILLVRTPHQLLSSVVNWFHLMWNIMSSPSEKYIFLEDIINLTKHWYVYPLKVLKTLSKSRWDLFYYQEYVTQPWIFIRRLYHKYQLKIHRPFHEILVELKERIRNYKSSHQHSPQDFGLSYKDIDELYKEVFQMYPILKTASVD